MRGSEEGWEGVVPFRIPYVKRGDGGIFAIGPRVSSDQGEPVSPGMYALMMRHCHKLCERSILKHK